MKRSRWIVATLLAVVLLVSFLVTASAEGKAYGRWDNPGNGHDYSGQNNNENKDFDKNDHGYLNHMPHDDGGDPSTSS